MCDLWLCFTNDCKLICAGVPNPFIPKSDQFQISAAASPEILQHTVWRTWLFIAYSDERWLYLPICYVLFNIGSERVKHCGVKKLIRFWDGVRVTIAVILSVSHLSVHDEPPSLTTDILTLSFAGSYHQGSYPQGPLLVPLQRSLLVCFLQGLLPDHLLGHQLICRQMRITRVMTKAQPASLEWKTKGSTQQKRKWGQYRRCEVVKTMKETMVTLKVCLWFAWYASHVFHCYGQLFPSCFIIVRWLFGYSQTIVWLSSNWLDLAILFGQLLMHVFNCLSWLVLGEPFDQGFRLWQLSYSVSIRRRPVSSCQVCWWNSTDFSKERRCSFRNTSIHVANGRSARLCSKGDVVRIGIIIICQLNELWKAKFFILPEVIFLVRLQGKLTLITLGSERINHIRENLLFSYMPQAWTQSPHLPMLKEDHTTNIYSHYSTSLAHFSWKCWENALFEGVL